MLKDVLNTHSLNIEVMATAEVLYFNTTIKFVENDSTIVRITSFSIQCNLYGYHSMYVFVFNNVLNFLLFNELNLGNRTKKFI